MKGRDPAAADEAFWKGIQALDRLQEEGAEYLGKHIPGGPAALLPLVEQIDPTLAPEVFWRAVAARPPIGNPRSYDDDSPSELVERLVWYDREVATALFEPIRALIERTDDWDLFAWTTQFASWSLIDPRAAVARHEQLRATTDADAKALVQLKGFVAMRGLAPSYEERWRYVWGRHGYGEMRSPLERDIW